ncbi:MAG TPA: NAD(P)/FAD-dependent oxidoreductase [Solirubrobacteraceae bacterium]|nr:NAD(P)/FAD-dependent oxidoreductase [Solirubrobacteraceae bacterium]
MDYDALIVGSGPNGLAAAIELAAAGLSVLVLEAAPRPGGAVLTEELTLPGFRHDTFSSVYPAAAASPVFAALPLQRHGLRWVHPPVCLAHPIPDGRAVALHRDLQSTIQSLDSIRPGDGERWRAFAAPLLDHFDALRSTMLAGFPPVRGPARLALGLGPARLLDFARLLFTSVQSLAERLFEGEPSRAWLYGSAMHSDVPIPGPGSAIAGAYLNLLGHAAGWPSPEGGAGALADALIAHLRDLGGALRTDAEVVRVLTPRRRAVAVELRGGETISAPLVLADVMPAALARLAGHSLPALYARALRRYRHGPPTIKLDWALSGPIPWTAPEARQAGTVHVGGDAQELIAATAQARISLPDRPFLLLGQQSLADPTRAPAGRHTAWAYTHVPHGVPWDAERDRHIDRMEAQVERFAPGFRDLILARHVLDPAELQHRNPNLVGGDVGGGSYTLSQVLFRPVPSPAPYRTPLAGLYICSAATFPGGAVHGVPGHAAARLALAERRLRRWSRD